MNIQRKGESLGEDFPSIASNAMKLKTSNDINKDDVEYIFSLSTIVFLFTFHHQYCLLRYSSRNLYRAKENHGINKIYLFDE